MSRHASRSIYYVPPVGILAELAATNGKCPHFAPAAMPAPAEDPPDVPFRFGNMFDHRTETVKVLTQLGLAMEARQSNDSNNPSGYTYLGQFIAHEITFDRTKGLPMNGSVLQNHRSPQIDLDSLYGSDGDPASTQLFQDNGQSALLNIGRTLGEELIPDKQNDLFRDEATGKAIIADERNDENLAIAQVQVALMKFHNAIVEKLRAEGTAEAQLRETARAEVVKHFQWIILTDYLPTLLDPDVLHEVLVNKPQFYKPEEEDLFMPLEFSAAAFRLGHSMVRPSYAWNGVFPARTGAEALISDLFAETHFSGFIRPERDARPRLQSRWIIDWRRFFDFSVIRDNNDNPIYAAPPTGINRARQIDTAIDLPLAKITRGFNHDPFTGEQRSLAVRNLLRGYALGLPTGEDVAYWMDEVPLTQNEIAAGFEDQFNSRWLKGKTPLWFYILREAELKNSGDRLGRVGSRIVAETFVTLINHSRYSILKEPEWHPRVDASRPGPNGTRIFQMVDLLHFADVVNPINL